MEVNNLKKRCDIIVFNPQGSIDILVECKSYSSEINQMVFDQIARYNLRLQSKFLIVTNGLEHYFCKMDWEKEKYIFLKHIPDFSR